MHPAIQSSLTAFHVQLPPWQLCQQTCPTCVDELKVCLQWSFSLPLVNIFILWVFLSDDAHNPFRRNCFHQSSLLKSYSPLTKSPMISSTSRNTFLALDAQTFLRLFSSGLRLDLLWTGVTQLQMTNHMSTSWVSGQIQIGSSCNQHTNLPPRSRLRFDFSWGCYSLKNRRQSQHQLACQDTISLDRVTITTSTSLSPFTVSAFCCPLALATLKFMLKLLNCMLSVIFLYITCLSKLL